GGSRHAAPARRKRIPAPRAAGSEIHLSPRRRYTPGTRQRIEAHGEDLLRGIARGSRGRPAGDVGQQALLPGQAISLATHQESPTGREISHAYSRPHLRDDPGYGP